MAPHSSTLAWKIPWMEEAGGLQSMELQRVRHDLATKQQQAALVQCPILLQGLLDEHLPGTVLMALSSPWCYSAPQSTPAHCCIDANTFQLIYKPLSFNILLFWDQDDFETSVVFTNKVEAQCLSFFNFSFSLLSCLRTSHRIDDFFLALPFFLWCFRHGSIPPAWHLPPDLRLHTCAYHHRAASGSSQGDSGPCLAKNR